MLSRGTTSTTTAGLSVSAVALLVLTSCGGDSVEITEAEAGGEPVTPGEETTLDAPEPTDDDTDDSDPDDPDDDGLPPGGTERMDDSDFDESVHGEETEVYLSEEGAEVGVAGLAPDDDPLVVHAAPTGESEEVGELGPLDAVLLGGRERLLGAPEEQDSWAEVELADGYGWVETGQTDSGGRLLYFGGTEDITDDQAEFGTFGTADDAAEGVLEMATESGDDEDQGPAWTLISTPEDHGEEFYRGDVTGYMDDSVSGHRYFIYVEDTDGGYEVAQVETTVLCHRGVSDDGLCL